MFAGERRDTCMLMGRDEGTGVPLGGKRQTGLPPGGKITMANLPVGGGKQAYDYEVG
jgi:hypothetical protein